MPALPSPRKRLLWALGFNAVSAISGGLGMVTNAGLIPEDVLKNTPFETFQIPGHVLLWVVGGSSTVALAMALRKQSRSDEAALAAATILAGWLIMEFVWIPEGWLLQAFYLIVAGIIAEAALADRKAHAAMFAFVG